MKCNEILVIPDTHGLDFWRKSINSDLPKIFLGDMLDSYPDYQITFEKELKEFLDIIEFAKENPDTVTLLFGNHLLHYCGMSEDLARFNYAHSEELYNIIFSNKELFQVAFRWDNTLFSHAGISTGFLKQNEIEENPDTIVKILNSYIEFDDYWVKHPNWFSGDSRNILGQIGRARGGFAPNGSCDWADINEMWFNSAFKDSLIQIFAHSRLKETGTFLHNDNFYMCDSRAIFIWNGEELKLWK